MSAFAAYIDRELTRFHDELATFLRIPSISTDAEHAGDVRACADWVAGHLRAAGVPEAEVIQTGGHPIVVGERIHPFA